MAGPVRAVETDVAEAAEGGDSDAHMDKAVPEENKGDAQRVIAETGTGLQRAVEDKAWEEDKTEQRAA